MNFRGIVSFRSEGGRKRGEWRSGGGEKVPFLSFPFPFFFLVLVLLFFCLNSRIVVETEERDLALVVAHREVAAGRAEVERKHLAKARLAWGEVGESRPAGDMNQPERGFFLAAANGHDL